MKENSKFERIKKDLENADLTLDQIAEIHVVLNRKLNEKEKQ